MVICFSSTSISESLFKLPSPNTAPTYASLESSIIIVQSFIFTLVNWQFSVATAHTIPALTLPFVVKSSVISLNETFVKYVLLAFFTKLEVCDITVTWLISLAKYTDKSLNTAPFIADSNSGLEDFSK